jgi:uroporphyrinogen-III synthase
MQQNKIQILSTKSLLPSMIESAKKKNIHITAKEFIAIKPVQSKEIFDEVMPVVLNESVSSIVFTSANAVETIKKYLHQGATFYLPDWDVFCLSGKTKAALSPNITEKRIVASAENASALAQKIIEHNVKEIVFFCGNKRRDELPRILEKAGVKVKEIIVYETVETPVISAKEFDGILFFSPSAVSSFFSINHLDKEAVCFAIGKTTATSIEKYTDNRIIITESPTQEMTLETIDFYFKNINCHE